MNDFFIILAGVVLVGVPSTATASLSCLEPARPNLALLRDAGLSVEEVRSEFQTYFVDVEGFLNCINETSERVRVEARSAAYDLAQIRATFLNDVGSSPTPDGQVPADSNLDETGRLILFPLR
ncbi:hypothetical protein LV780_21675 (plasmid) [Cereibacter azotoformans]|uniref:hypothetical protein n=1 Tax=Cereibacter azotoformans TaxID=43057 RepID=UPI0011C16E58|nr:hypothetical protein [Cereibacter azotoformans]UIJ33257.1 hypothetical protein LV780_21675 [Cereibacter azotoformans]